MTHLRFATLAGLLALLCASSGCAPTPPTVTASPDSEAAKPTPASLDQALGQEVEQLAQLPPIAPRGLDHSGRKQTGRASYYGQQFTNRKMANGRRFNPDSDAAASKTLPLGTTATVTNVQNGRSATVTVEDRGPLIRGRVVDLTPKVAEQLDMKKTGVTQVIVAPVAVPQPNGAVKLGAGAAGATALEIEQATHIAEAATR